MTAKEFLKENGIPNMPTQFAKEEETEVVNTEQALEAYHQEQVKNLTIANVSNSEVALKAFVEEFVEAWEDGMGGDTDLYKKAKSLL